MTESFEDAIKALRHIARGNGNVLRIADRIVAAHERETKVEGVCGPITGELRAAMRQWGWAESDGSITFATSPTPPSIDAEKSLAISGSDFDRLCDAIDAIHAGLERDNAELRAARGDDWIKLPVDADGLPIRIGDVMEWIDLDGKVTVTCSVDAVGVDCFFAWDKGNRRYAQKCANAYRHHHVPTVDDVLREFAEKITDSQIPGVHPTYEEAIAEYTQRLTLAGDAE